MITEVTKGSYRIPLVAGLRELNELELAKKIEDGIIKMGFLNQMRSSDQPDPLLTTKCVAALNTESARKEADHNVLDYYSVLLTSGASVMAIVGDGFSGSGVGGPQYYASGELFFRS